MTRRPLSARDRRALRFGVLVAAPALAWGLVVRPYVQAERRAADQLAGERALLARELGLVAARAQLTRLEGEATRSLADLTPRFFAAGSAGESSAAFVEYVADAADAADVELGEMEPGGVGRDTSGVSAMPLAVRGHGDMTGVLTLIRAVERGAKLVRVDGIEVRAAADGERADAGTTDGGPLAFRLSLTGFVLRRDGARPPAAPVPLDVGLASPGTTGPASEPRP